jgi:hypothetical protein
MALFGGTSKHSLTKRLFTLFRSDRQEQQLEELRHSVQERTKKVAQEDYEWWNALPYEERLRAFRSVCRRIQQGDVVERGSYRHVLYEVFGFDADAYVDGMDCGYMDIHNLIARGHEEVPHQESM